jgi:pimeloyl-ACP methyl ester carboxylesterase
MEVLSGAPVLVVTFGGVKHGTGIGVPPFEFLRSLSSLGCDAIFLRDFSQAWYQFGVDGVAGDVAGLAQWLRNRKHGYRRTVVLGNSMGGYAALLFGRLAEFDVVIAFNPQTTIAPPDLAALGDRRWQLLIDRMRARSAAGGHDDVRAGAPRSGAVEGTSLLFFGAGSRDDAAHAMRLAGEPGCHLFAVRDSRHDAVKMLRDAGILARILGMICDPAVGLPALLGELRAESRLTAVGGQGPLRTAVPGTA